MKGPFKEPYAPTPSAQPVAMPAKEPNAAENANARYPDEGHLAKVWQSRNEPEATPGTRRAAKGDCAPWPPAKNDKSPFRFSGGK